MNAADYLKLRVEDQIKWMEGKSKWNQSRYKVLKVTEIVAAAMIPLLVSYQGTMENLKTFLGITTGLLGVLIVILSSLRQLYKYQENWLTYRTTLESMKREKFLFETNASPYDDALAFQKFVINIESLLAKENESWKAVWSQVVPAPGNLSPVPPDPEIPVPAVDEAAPKTDPPVADETMPAPDQSAVDPNASLPEMGAGDAPSADPPDAKTGS